MKKRPSNRSLARIVAHIKAHTKKDIAILLATVAFFGLGIIALWISSFRLPDLSSFDNRKVFESTKIYDKTGEILLYDLHDSVKRTIVASEDISNYIKQAMVAIEDENFYTHRGIKVSSFLRAVIVNIMSGSFSQGGSTITQQVVKNTLLTGDKRPSRKIKEWVLAVKLDKVLSKDAILTTYLNENPYGGSMYGVEEASRQFFNKQAKEVTLAEAAYLAAIPRATTFYSPYGKNIEKLEERKNLVLRKMLELDFITEEEYKGAMAEVVTFQPQGQYGIKAPHFVFFVKEYLENILGKGSLDDVGYKVITTLDAPLQEHAEELVKTTALANTENFNATNAALVAIDPKTGGILAMVGSRDYFDKEIDGQFNVAISPNRQPGSTMKPIIYAKAFEKGYTPDTVVFDLQTSFSTECDLEGKPLDGTDDTLKCFMPGNYDEKFRGPISLRDALAQSINVPAVKVFYLAGVRDALALAKDMGITTLGDSNRYGLSLVLGSGEISLLQMTSAYGTFANDGVRVPYRPVLKLLDARGNEIKLPSQKQTRVMPANVAQMISDVLSDNNARIPAYGANSVLNFPTRDVAVKTGTTNDSRDAWTIGYSPNIVVGVWAGNNDNSPMVKKVAGQIVAPMWSTFMRGALDTLPDERFIPPTYPDPSTLKPVLKGIWQGGTTYTIDTISGKLATEFTPQETRKEIAIRSIHSILYWVDKDNPLGPAPTNPAEDSQFERWESPIRAWAAANNLSDEDQSVVPREIDNVHTQANSFSVSIQNLDQTRKYGVNDSMAIYAVGGGRYPLTKASLYINNTFVETTERAPFIFRFSPNTISNIQEVNQIKIVGHDSVSNRAESIGQFNVALDN